MSEVNSMEKILIQKIEESLKYRVNLIDELMGDYDITDPDFDDTYGEGYYDRLWDERIYMNFLLEKIDMLKTKDA